METVLTFARSELRKYYKKTTGADACEIELGIEPSLLEKGDDVKSDDRFPYFRFSRKGKDRRHQRKERSSRRLSLLPGTRLGVRAPRRGRRKRSSKIGGRMRRQPRFFAPITAFGP